MRHYPLKARCGQRAERFRHERNEQTSNRIMKRTATKHILLLCLLAGLFCTRLAAQSYSIDWYKVSGGGATSTNGQYSVSGTIGQPDAGAMSGGNFSLQGGFWGIAAAVQTEGAPFLTVTRSNNVVVVSWPLPSEGWVLEWTNALPQSAVAWPQISPPYQTNGAGLQYTAPFSAGNRFYRLHKP
jgi:hypothetical protein